MENINHQTHCLPQQRHVPEKFQVKTLNGINIFEITIAQLAQCFTQQDFSCVEYTEFCIERIKTINPYLNAVIDINPNASAIAIQCDQERKVKKPRGLLHGIPVLVKDNIATKDSVDTTAGSLALQDSTVNQSATVVTLLQVAGAIILGHANMSEWASCRSSQYSTGYSPRGGQTRNPYNLSKTPFGSSSGSAVAVSANIVPLALGTETDTSIINPASINGIVGIKPTVGLTSREGVIPISQHMDSVGVFARNVADAAILLDAIVAIETKISIQPNQLSYDKFYTTQCSTWHVLKTARFGLPHKKCWQQLEVGKSLAEKVLATIVKAGAQIFEIDLPSIDERVNDQGTWNWKHGNVDKSEWTVVKVDAYNGIKHYLSQLASTPINSIEDIIVYNEHHKEEGPNPGDLSAFASGQDQLIEIAKTKGIEDSSYKKALHHTREQTRQNGIDAALGENIDALIFFDRKGIGQQYAAQAGYPIICIPIGVDEHGMPLSLSLQHSARKETHLIKWASAIESIWRERVGHRNTPTYRNYLANNIPIGKVL